MNKTTSLTKEELLRALSDDKGELIPKRCSEKYLIKFNLFDSLNHLVSSDFKTVKEKIIRLKYGGGYCIICGKRTNFADRVFRERCYEHRYAEVKRITFDDVVPDDVVSLYEQGWPISRLAKHYSTSHKAVRDKLLFLDVKLKTLSETQLIRAAEHKRPDKFNRPKEFWENAYASKSTSEISKELGCCETTVLNRLRRYGIVIDPTKRSNPEIKICNFLDELGVFYLTNNRNVIKQELDIYLPKQKLAIECNGIYYHSELFKPKNYHLNKTNFCEKQGITLLQFWDIEIENNFDILKSMIKSKCKVIDIKIPARKCNLVEIDKNTAKVFSDATHLQGHCNASLYIGLFHQNELIAVASFSKPRFNKTQNTLELIRFSSKLNYTIIGGLSKILSYMKKRCDCSILSYANRRWTNSSSNIYNSIGFECIGHSSPNYFYSKNFNALESRLKYQKHKLKQFDNFAEDKTEKEIMNENGYYQLYDSGNLTYILK